MTSSPPLDIDDNTGQPTGLTLFELIKTRMGWTDKYLDEVNDPSHPLLADVDIMGQALEYLREHSMPVVVIPDFDTDGICAGTILYAGLSELGLDVRLHVPDYHLGHEIRPEVIDTVLREHPDARAIMTCDAGTNSTDALTRAAQANLLTLVTDHHVEEARSVAHIIVNPNRMAETYPNKEVCGAHVAYQVVERYAAVYRPHQLGSIGWLKVFAGIGTVGDVMSLVRENRDLVREALMLTKLLIPTPPHPQDARPTSVYEEPDPDGNVTVEIDRTPTLLSMLRSQHHHPVYMRVFEGLNILLQELGTTSDHVDEQLYGFSIAPTFNSTRRVDGDYRAGFAVFTAPSPEEQAQAAQTLVGYNQERKSLTRQVLDEVVSTNQPGAPYVYVTQALPGMLGLIAQNLMQVNEHPVAVVRVHDDGSCSGSMRSPTWFPVITELARAQGHHVTAQGHEFACGMRAPSVTELHDVLDTLVPARRQRVLDSGQSLVQDAPAALVLGHTPQADASLSETRAITECMRLVRGLAPFGHGFPLPPVDVVVNLSTCTIHTMGDADQHLKVITPEGVALLWWNRSDMAPLLRERAASPDTEDTTCVLRVTMGTNTFRGITTVQGVVDHERPFDSLMPQGGH